MDKIFGGLGIVVNADNAGNGILNSTAASLMYSYRLQAAKNLFINMAIEGSFYQKSLNWGKLQFADMIDPNLGFVNMTSEAEPNRSSVTFPDFSAGIAFGFKGILHGGVAVNHLTEPNMAFYDQNENKLPMKITGHLGVNINLGSSSGGISDDEGADFYLSPNVLYQQQGPWHQLNAGLYVVRLPVVIGAWFRHNFENSDAVIALVGIQFQNFKVGYSYDLTLSQLKSSTGGAHEVSLAWQFNCIEKKRRLRAIKCPEF